VGSGLYVTVLAGGVGIVAGAIGFAGAGKASQQIEPPEPPSELQFTEITSELRALTKLRDDGLITQDEYDEMRRRLADRL
ncbi:MAG: SHOCT domain-containing protein, partial [Dehalococcoidia bacterium]|nr:SHOCT domain-containing protein [Dehalococcoidia bacterium]